jgi:hypothetical protein
MGSCSSAAPPQQASKMQCSSTEVRFAIKFVLCVHAALQCMPLIAPSGLTSHPQQRRAIPTHNMKLSQPDKPSVSLGPPHPQLQEHDNAGSSLASSFAPLLPDESASINLLEAAQVRSLPYTASRCPRAQQHVLHLEFSTSQSIDMPSSNFGSCVLCCLAQHLLHLMTSSSKIMRPNPSAWWKLPWFVLHARACVLCVFVCALSISHPMYVHQLRAMLSCPQPSPVSLLGQSHTFSPWSGEQLDRDKISQATFYPFTPDL